MLMNIDNITSINNIINNGKIAGISIFNPVFLFMLLAVKPFEIFPRKNRYSFTSESFTLNQYIFVAWTKKRCCFHYNEGLNKMFFPILKK